MATATSNEEILARLEELTIDARRVQLETLSNVLAANAGAGYLRRYLPDAAASTAISDEEFRRLVPISSYEDYAATVERIADGVGSPAELSLCPLLCFFLSSGTSSMRPKLVPFFDSPHAKAASALINQASSALLRRLFPPRTSINKILWFLYAGNVTRTTGGFEAMAATAWGIRSSVRGHFPLISFCVSPPAVILSSDNQQQLYCHLLCGLCCSNSVDAIRAPYAAGLVRAIQLLQAKWQQLCDDIESGRVSEEITDKVMREAVQDLLAEPRPDLANRIREICQKESWGGILCGLWPEIRYISCITTGSMEQYYPAIKYFAGPSVQLLGVDYLASECPVGINRDRMLPPEQTSYVLLPSAAYFEFLPFVMEETSSEQRATVDISGVEVGRMYEIVATTFRGLYRYRLGDVVKVVGFHNSSPRLQFVTRAPKEPSEMITERDLMSAMESFQLMLKEHLKGDITEFAGFSCTDANTTHVNIFVEVSKESKLLKANLEESTAFLRRCSASLEGCLGSSYKLRRDHGEVGPLEIAVVSPGSFERLAEAALQNGAPANQYKPPKIIRHQHLVEVLKASVVCNSQKDQ